MEETSPPSACEPKGQDAACDYIIPLNLNDEGNRHGGGNQQRDLQNLKRRRSNMSGDGSQNSRSRVLERYAQQRRESTVSRPSPSRRSSLFSLGSIVEDMIFGQATRSRSRMSEDETDHLLQVIDDDDDNTDPHDEDDQGRTEGSERTATSPHRRSSLDISSSNRSGIIRNMELVNNWSGRRASVQSYLTDDDIPEERTKMDEMTVPLSVGLDDTDTAAAAADNPGPARMQSRRWRCFLLVVASTCMLAGVLALAYSLLDRPRRRGPAEMAFGPISHATAPIIGAHNNIPPVPHISKALEMALQQIKTNDEQMPAEEMASSSTKKDDIFSVPDEEDQYQVSMSKAAPMNLNKKKKRPLQVLVECTKPDGCLEAIKKASSVNIANLTESSRLVSLNVDPDAFDELRSIEHINLDLDYELEAVRDDLIDAGDDIGITIDIAPNNQGGALRGRSRRAGQQIPPGFRMIQAIRDDGTPFPPGPHRRKICIADTGTCKDHPDLLPRFPSQLNGADLTLDGGATKLRWDVDRDGHGCHNNGLINAAFNNVGYFGIGGSDVFITRGLRDNRKAAVSQLLMAMNQCVFAGASIIILALGCTHCRSSMAESFFQGLADKGIMIFSAAGNFGNDDQVGPMYPASFPNSVISVGAVNIDGSHWWLSSKNEQVEFCAHGSSVISTGFHRDGDAYLYDYVHKSGTSMSVPQVAAVASQLWSYFPRCTAQQIRSVLAFTARKIDDGSGSRPRCTTRCGFGIVQLQAAYNLLRASGEGNEYDCLVAGPILSSTERVCDCIDSNYQPSSCLSVAGMPSTIAAPQASKPKCLDNRHARIKIGRAGRYLQKKRKRGGRRKRFRLSCSNIRKVKSKTLSWCRASFKARNSCKHTCASVGIEYEHCVL